MGAKCTNSPANDPASTWVVNCLVYCLKTETYGTFVLVVDQAPPTCTWLLFCPLPRHGTDWIITIGFPTLANARSDDRLGRLSARKVRRPRPQCLLAPAQWQ